MTDLERELKLCKKQFYNKNKKSLITSIILQIIIAAINVLLAFFLMTAINSMEQKDTVLLVQSLIFLAVIVVSFLIISMLLKTVKNSYLKRASSQFKDYIFSKILSKSIGEYRSVLSGRLISSFSNDLSTIEANYLDGTIMLIYNLFMLGIAMVAMAYINIWIMLAVLLACTIPLVLSLVCSKKLIKKEEKTSDENASFIDQMKDLLNGFFVIKSFKAEKEVLEVFSERNVSLEETKHDRRDASDIMDVAGKISSLLVIAIIIILGVFFTFTGLMQIATVIGCIQLSNYIVDPVKALVPLLSNRKSSNALITKIAAVIKEENVENSRVEINDFKSAVELSDVSYVYDGGKTALNNINLRFDKGGSYALVGDSGSGKSTLVKLLLGYFNNYSGCATYDGVEIKDIDLDNLYDVASVVQQNVFLFDKSIMNNITMFKDFPNDSKEAAISRAGLSKLIKEKGENYVCGEGGSNLSGGEKQRISIARCLIKETPILIMDEATAALDNTQAFQIENDILDMKDLTRIVVTHRLEENLLSRYNQIIVMRNGSIEETGTFEQLLDAKGYFYSLYNVTQNSINLSALS